MSCQVGEVESHLEVTPQELGLQNSPSGPGEPLSHMVKEESDTEQELGGAISTVVCGALLGTAAGGVKSELEMMMLPRVGLSVGGSETGYPAGIALMRISRACNLNHVVTSPYPLDFGFEEGGGRKYGWDYWEGWGELQFVRAVNAVLKITNGETGTSSNL